MSQTSLQNQRCLRFGSGKVEVGEDTSSLVDLGAIDDAAFKETWTVVKVLAGNIKGAIIEKIKDHYASISCNWLEPDLTKLALIRGGLDNASTIAGTQVTGATQTVAANGWAFNKFIPFVYENADGSAPTVSSVAAATDGSLVKDTDYYIGKNERGKWGLFVIDSSTVTTVNQNLTITMTYTPAAAKVLKSGGKTIIASRVVRVTNTNEDGKKFQITIYKAQNESAIELSLPNEDADDPAKVPITLTGSCDDSRTEGEQLFEIVDEQGL